MSLPCLAARCHVSRKRSISGRYFSEPPTSNSSRLLDSPEPSQPRCQLRRIGLAVVLAVSLSLAPHVAEAQQRDQIPRVGYLSPGSPDDQVRLRRFEAFRQGLRELGYAEGQNIAIESRWAEGNYDRYAVLAADLVRVKSNVIVAVGGAATQAVQQATRTIPIVMSTVLDPVGSRLVTRLARPEGNVTGLSMMGPDIIGKQLQVLREVVPKVSRVAALWNPANP